MPWVDPPATRAAPGIVLSGPNPDSIFLESPMGVEAAPPMPPPSGDAILGAAFSRENIVVNAARKLSEEKYPVESGYNPLQDERVLGTKYESQYADKFTWSFSGKDTERIIHDIEREERDNATLAAGGWAGVGASVVAGILDPTIFLPGGAYVRGARGGLSLTRTGASVSTAATAATALQESILQQSQQLRTAEESAFNIGAATLLSGIYGGTVRLG